MPLDYIAIGPIFATTTKENPDAVVGLERLKIIREAIGDFPLVAIGGINFQNAKDVLSHGADSVAAISQILREPAKITQSFHQFVKHLQK
jgi:thiamine-phosphate pyrophosphorylase